MTMNKPKGRLAKCMAFYARNRAGRNTRAILHNEDEALKIIHITKGGFTHVMAIPKERGTSKLITI